MQNMFMLVLYCLIFFTSIQDVVTESSLLPYLQPVDIDSGCYDDTDNLDDNICCRTCVEGETKTCYYRLVVEPYIAMGSCCGNCSETNNTIRSDCYKEGCVTADGCPRSILTINRRMPGPSIQVCEGDKVIIDVKNMMGGKTLTIHWHGLKQKDSKYMDGVPMVSQCPINEGQIFRYHFYANDTGLHFYHSHAGLQKVDGVVGGFVVRQVKSKDPNCDLYDYDLPSHVIVIQDWHHMIADALFPGHRKNYIHQMPESYLIQGRGIYYYPNKTKCADSPLAMFNVTRGYKYLFNIIAGTCYECQYVFTIESHDMIVIGADSNPCEPYRVDSLTMSPGERFSVVVNCNKSVDTYWMEVRGIGYCEDLQAYQLALLRYDEDDGDPSSAEPDYEVTSVNDPGITMNPINSNCTDSEEEEEGPCVEDLRSCEDAPDYVLTDQCTQIVWVFGFYLFTDECPATNDTKYARFLTAPNATVSSMVNGVCWVPPPCPLMSQWDQVPEHVMCPEEGFPYDTWNEELRECVNVIPIPLNECVEILMVDAGDWDKNGMSHSIHLHGYDMWVMDEGPKPEYATLAETMDALKTYMNSTERKAMPSNPVRKDTIALSAGGYCITRIYTDNPGYWFFHCHFAYHLDSGMAGVLRAGNHSDYPAPPDGFPTCGDYLPVCD